MLHYTNIHVSKSNPSQKGNKIVKIWDKKGNQILKVGQLSKSRTYWDKQISQYRRKNVQNEKLQFLIEKYIKKQKIMLQLVDSHPPHSQRDTENLAEW